MLFSAKAVYHKCRKSCLTPQLQEVDAALDVVAWAPDNSDGFLVDACERPNGEFYSGNDESDNGNLRSGEVQRIPIKTYRKREGQEETPRMAHAARLTGTASTHPPPLTLKRRLQRALKAADEMRLAIDESHTAEQGCAARDSSCRLARVSTAHSNHGAKTRLCKTHKRKVKERGGPRQDKEEARQWVRHARAGRVTRTRRQLVASVVWTCTIRECSVQVCSAWKRERDSLVKDFLCLRITILFIRITRKSTCRDVCARRLQKDTRDADRQTASATRSAIKCCTDAGLSQSERYTFLPSLDHVDKTRKKRHKDNIED